MDKSELQTFLGKFGIVSSEITKFISDKKLVSVNNNVFLIDEKISLKSNQVYTNGLIFINLRKFLPSKFLLDFVSTNSRCLILKSYLKALDFSYGKNLKRSDFEYFEVSSLVSQDYYIIVYKDEVYGYGHFEKGREDIFVNDMNIGEYLKES